MKVQFSVDSGANIHSCNNSGWFDPVKDLGYSPGEWEKMSDDDKWQAADEWAQNYLEISYEEKED